MAKKNVTRKKRSTASARTNKLYKFKPTKKGLLSRKGLLFIAAFAIIGGLLAFRAFAAPVVEHFEGDLGGTKPTSTTLTFNMNNGPWLVALQSRHPDLNMKLTGSKGNVVFETTPATAVYGRWQLPSAKWSWKSGFYGIAPDTYTLTITDTKPGDPSNYIVSIGYNKNIPAPPTGGQFYEDFSNTNALTERFDFGWSGVNPVDVNSSLTTYKGDHDMNCGAPTTLRDVNLKGTGPNMNFNEAFWQCNPGGDPAKGHLMTGMNTFGYNHLWFSPKSTYSNIHQVCWDQNETQTSSRKWTEVQFVGTADAHKYPTGSIVENGPTPILARGTGGFDLGYTDVGFRGSSASGPTTGLVPSGGNMAGFKLVAEIGDWWQNDNQLKAEQINWPGTISGYTGYTITDKAARYKHCLTDNNNGTITFTSSQPTASGVVPKSNTIAGSIPKGATRVVFHDASYDAPKGEKYDPNVLTWHWDNIQIN